MFYRAISTNMMTDFEHGDIELWTNLSLAGSFLFLLMLFLFWVSFGNSFTGTDEIWSFYLEASFLFKVVPFGLGKVSLLLVLWASLFLRFFFGVGIDGADEICSWSYFSSIIVCSTFDGISPYSLWYTWSRPDVCSNKKLSVGS